MQPSLFAVRVHGRKIHQARHETVPSRHTPGLTRYPALLSTPPLSGLPLSPLGLTGRNRRLT